MSKARAKRSKKLSRALKMLANRIKRKSEYALSGDKKHDTSPDNYRAGKPGFPGDRMRRKAR